MKLINTERFINDDLVIKTYSILLRRDRIALSIIRKSDGRLMTTVVSPEEMQALIDTLRRAMYQAKGVQL